MYSLEEWEGTVLPRICMQLDEMFRNVEPMLGTESNRTVAVDVMEEAIEEETEEETEKTDEEAVAKGVPEDDTEKTEAVSEKERKKSTEIVDERVKNQFRSLGRDTRPKENQETNSVKSSNMESKGKTGIYGVLNQNVKPEMITETNGLEKLPESAPRGSGIFLYGVDFIVDELYRPFILEVNTSPQLMYPKAKFPGWYAAIEKMTRGMLSDIVLPGLFNQKASEKANTGWGRVKDLMGKGTPVHTGPSLEEYILASGTRPPAHGGARPVEAAA